MVSVYLDHAATTPLHPSVLEAMLPFLSEHFGNPSSIHSPGRISRAAMNDARDRIAACLGCEPGQLVFTSGGTESDNMAIFGVAMAHKENKGHIITSQIEHHAVLDACRRLEKLGFAITYLPVDHYGQVSIEAVAAAIRPDTALISIMYGNNEVGSLQPIADIGRLARDKGIYMHVDAVQALGVEKIDLRSLPVDLMSFSAHKINGPKGVGALYLSTGVMMVPQIFGGSQERKRRAGTENLAGIVGFAKAVELVSENMEEKQQNLNSLRQIMVDTWEVELGGTFVVNGHPSARLPHILNVSFPGADTETMLMNLDLEGIAASSGSACTSGALEVSHVLQAMNLSAAVTDSALRFSFGMGNTSKSVRDAALKTATIANRLRNR